MSRVFALLGGVAMLDRLVTRVTKPVFIVAALCLFLWPKFALASPVTYTYTGAPIPVYYDPINFPEI